MAKVTKAQAKKKEDNRRVLTGLLALAAQGGIVKQVQRDGSQLKVTYVNGLNEIITFAMPWQAVLVTMTLRDLNTCVEQAIVTKFAREHPVPHPE